MYLNVEMAVHRINLHVGEPAINIKYISDFNT